MHRNSYLNSPKVLRQSYQSKLRDDLFFAGQMTGVEGYIESCASGMAAAINMARLVQNKELIVFPQETMIGSMAYYITHASPDYFQPMNANFGIVPLRAEVRKSERKEAYGKQALKALDSILEEINHG
jgi:methylenetetrahydrofolate--tRNA-(uracil-5-)-methyltransferase